MSGIQIILIIVIVTLTLLLVIVGLQVILILWGVRKLLSKVSLMVEGKERLEDLEIPDKVKKFLMFIKRRA